VTRDPIGRQLYVPELPIERLAADRQTYNPAVERSDVPDRQFDALLERLDRIAEQLERIDSRLERQEALVAVSGELRNLNESLNALAYAALGQSPQVRRRRAG
jgi:hypothetical protein